MRRFFEQPSAAQAALAAAAVLAAVGCRTPGQWRKVADARADELLAAARADAGAEQEKISVETPADTLRRRLLLDQGLPVFHPASYGIRDLPASRYWDPDARLEPGEPPPDFAASGSGTLQIGAADAVRIAAHASREFQSRKQSLFAAALSLDLENKTFRSTFRGLMESALSSTRGGESSRRETSHSESAAPGVSRKFENGAEFSGGLAVNLAGMLSGDRATAWGAIADISVSIPLLRGSGTLVNRESLTQAERDLVYAVRDFEQYKREFAVDVQNAYLSLLLAKSTRQNEDDNYRRVILSTRRSRRMADASRMSTASFEQSYQSELSARASWIAACQSYESALESFKIKLGLPPDARIEPRDEDLAELLRISERYRGETESADAETQTASAEPVPSPAPAAAGDGSPATGSPLDSIALAAPESVDYGELRRRTDEAVKIAFSNRGDVLNARDRIEDAQRHLAVAEDSLRGEITLGGSARVGQAASPGMGREGKSHADFEVRETAGSGTLRINPPIERTAERNAYRNALLAVETAVREWQEREDSLKRTIRQDMRDAELVAEQLRIQFRAVDLAARRVRNQDLLLEAGRADMTDVLDAQAALVSAQNALYRAITERRSRELALQRDIGTLRADASGIWSENIPEGILPSEGTEDGERS
ncbi:MAG: TolC family protein [Kiritimatiellae bacterium]|nr:TolC family protein [Kiritimatiellia bacterium]